MEVDPHTKFIIGDVRATSWKNTRSARVRPTATEEEVSTLAITCGPVTNAAASARGQYKKPAYQQYYPTIEYFTQATGIVPTIINRTAIFATE